MKTGARLFAIAFFLAAALGFARPCAAVSLRSATEVDRPTVKLSDVFDQLPEGIDCDIARAPSPGKSITYSASVLSNLARQYKLDWQPQSLADHTTITTAGTVITADDIRPYIVDKIKALGIKGDIDVLFDSHIIDITVPSSATADLALNNFSYDSINKRFRGDLVANGFTGPANFAITGHIVVRKSVPVLVRRLEAGTIISASDIDWLTVDEDRSAGAVTNPEHLINHELQRDTDGGVPVSERDVIAPRLVIRGALVTMKIETPYMVVTSQGRALQDGKRGDVVRVSNTQSNRMVEGIVESAGVVRIAAAQKLAAAGAEARQE